MRVSMWMMYDALAAIVGGHRLNDLSGKRCLGGVLPHIAEEAFTDDRLYVVDATGGDVFRIPDERCYLLIVGEGYEPSETHLCQCLYVNSSVGVMRAVAAAERAYQRYGEWYDRLNAELLGNHDLNRLCEIGAEMLDNPIMIYDRDYAVIGNNLFPAYPEYFNMLDRQSSYYITKPDALAVLKSMPSFRETFETHGAEMFKATQPLRTIPGISTIDSLYVNFGYGHVYEGRIVIPQRNHAARQGDYQLAEILCDVVRIALKQPSMRSNELGQVFRTYLVSLIEGHAADDRQLADSLKLWEWPRRGRFLCLCMGLAEGNSETSADLFICTKVELEVPGSCAIRYGGDIVCAMRLGDGETAEETVTDLDALLEGFVSHIGVSSDFGDVLEMHDYYREAAIALRMGVRDAPESRVHRFADFALRHYHEHGTSELSAIHFCDSDVRRLMAYRGERKDYYHILRTYLEQGLNQTRTAEVLYIHRATLFNYLNEIRDIIDADLDDADDRLRLLLSFEIMRMGEKEG